jgi:hypothetical protein
MKGRTDNGLRDVQCRLSTLRKAPEWLVPVPVPKCKRTYTELHKRVLDTMYIPEDRAVLALQLLLEGNSIRSTERITKLDRNTIMSLLVLAGQRCQALMNSKMQNLRPRHLQIDEIWTYVQKKSRHVRKGDSPEGGDQWVFVAIDADQS